MPNTARQPAQTPGTLTPYTPRALCRFDTLFSEGWHIKTYGISAHHKRPAESLFQQLGKLAPRITRQISDEFDSYKTAFAILHEAMDGNFILFHWWTGENMLASRVFHAPHKDAPFTDIAATHIIACIWELEIIKFERDLWVETVLNHTGQPDFETYLTKHCEVAYV